MKLLSGTMIFLFALVCIGYDVQAQRSSSDIICDAISRGDNKAVKKEIASLVSSVANVSVEISKQKTCGYPIDFPILRAIQSGNLEVVTLLLSHGVDINSTKALMFAIEQKQPEAAKVLIDHKASLDTGQGDYGNGPVHYATHFNQEDILRYLFENGADANGLNSNRNTPLYYAIKEGHKGCAQTLIKHGANTKSDSYEKSPLYIAIQYGQADIVQLLLDANTNVEYVNQSLMHVIQVGEKDRKDIVELLLKKGANVNYVADGDTPLIAAFSRDKMGSAELLLKYGADINAVDGKAATVLKVGLLTEKVCKPEKIQMLLDRGADINAVTDLESVLQSIRHPDTAATLRSLLLGRACEPKESASEYESDCSEDESSDGNDGLLRCSLDQLIEDKGDQECISDVRIINKKTGEIEKLRAGEVVVKYYPVMMGAIPGAIEFMTSFPDRYSIGDRVCLQYTKVSCCGCNCGDFDSEYGAEREKITFTIRSKRGLCAEGHSTSQR